MYCDHFFVTGEMKPTPSSTANCYCYCLHCGRNYFEEVADKYSQLLEEQSKLDPSQRLTKEEKERTSHIHVWDKIDGKKYKCVSNITDWEKTNAHYARGERITFRIPCGQILYI